nr:glycerophosphodiester phosphodiesterase [Paenibacillus dendritiformis]
MPLDVWSQWTGSTDSVQRACLYLEQAIGAPLDRDAIRTRHGDIFYTYKQLDRAENRIQLSPVYAHRDIVKLDDILDITKQRSIKLNLDIKNEDTVAPAMECVLRHGMGNQVFVTGCGAGIAGKYDGIRVVYNTPDELSEADIADYGAFARRACDEALRCSAYGLNMDYRTCRRELVEAAHERQLAVWVYTINASEEFKRYIGMGVDAITTRTPLALLELKPSARQQGDGLAAFSPEWNGNVDFSARARYNGRH